MMEYKGGSTMAEGTKRTPGGRREHACGRERRRSYGFGPLGGVSARRDRDLRYVVARVGKTGDPTSSTLRFTRRDLRPPSLISFWIFLNTRGAASRRSQVSWFFVEKIYQIRSARPVGHLSRRGADLLLCDRDSGNVCASPLAANNLRVTWECYIVALLGSAFWDRDAGRRARAVVDPTCGGRRSRPGRRDFGRVGRDPTAIIPRHVLLSAPGFGWAACLSSRLVIVVVLGQPTRWRITGGGRRR